MTTTEDTTLEALAATVKLIDLGTGPSLAWDKRDEWQRNANGYRLQLQYQGRVYSFDFWQGVGCKEAPTAAGCLECLLLDSSASDEDFDGYCDSFGFDPDSRKAYSTWIACRRAGRNMQRLLGDDFEAFMYADR